MDAIAPPWEYYGEKTDKIRAYANDNDEEHSFCLCQKKRQVSNTWRRAPFSWQTEDGGVPGLHFRNRERQVGYFVFLWNCWNNNANNMAIL